MGRVNPQCKLKVRGIIGGKSIRTGDFVNPVSEG